MAAHFLFLTWFFLTDVYFARHEVDDSPMESVDKTDEVDTSELAPGSLFDSGAGTCLFFFFLAWSICDGGTGHTAIITLILATVKSSTRFCGR